MVGGPGAAERPRHPITRTGTLVVLHDAQNEGVFESVPTYTPNEWLASPYIDTAVWRKIHWAPCPP